MSYARRTCHCCGMVKPVNLMHQVEVLKEVGHTKDRLTAGTMVGMMLGAKESQRRVRKRMFANNKRSHHRTVTKWECYPSTCHMSKKESEAAIEQVIQEAANQPNPEDLSFSDWVMVLVFFSACGAGLWYGGKWVLNFFGA